jgi:anti-sigma factor RsiW
MTASANQDLACKEFVELVTEYLEGTLPPATRTRVDEHLASCPFCHIYLEQMRQTIQALGHLPEESVSPEALDILLKAFRR